MQSGACTTRTMQSGACSTCTIDIFGKKINYIVEIQQIIFPNTLSATFLFFLAISFLLVVVEPNCMSQQCESWTSL